MRRFAFSQPHYGCEIRYCTHTECTRRCPVWSPVRSNSGLGTMWHWKSRQVQKCAVPKVQISSEALATDVQAPPCTQEDSWQ